MKTQLFVWLTVTDLTFASDPRQFVGSAVMSSVGPVWAVGDAGFVPSLTLDVVNHNVTPAVGQCRAEVISLVDLADTSVDRVRHGKFHI